MKTYKTAQKAKRETLEIHEDFIPYNVKLVDSKNRITLGGKLKKIMGKRMDVEAYQVYLAKNGDILLRPTVSIPSSEAWVYQDPKVIANLRKGLREAGEGKTERVNDLDSYLDSL